MISLKGAEDIDVHEAPSIPNYYPSAGLNPRIKNGMVVAIEPMLNLGTQDVFVEEDKWTVRTADGKISAHFEHTIAFFDNQYEIMTQI